GQAAFRAEALALADRLAVPVGWLVCQAPPEVVNARLAQRTHDASDADWQVHLLATAAWEPPDPVTAERMGVVEMSGQPGHWLPKAIAHLTRWELAGPPSCNASSPPPAANES
ncbi:MAG: AAA family ATPase, partial [Planctomycetaceae bacterium]